MFYYKLNLAHKNFIWYGSRLCKKHLISPQWLRNIKSKKYPLWRIDSFFSSKKLRDVDFTKWWMAFYKCKVPEKIDFKMKNFCIILNMKKVGLK